MPDIFYFLHIPKTAGTTFNFSVLPQLFTEEEICPAYSYRQLCQIALSELSRYRLYRGHFYYPLYRLLPSYPMHMTFLREPVERVLSSYNHICRDPEHFSHREVLALKGGLGEFVRNPKFLSPDFQVAALACDFDPAEAWARAKAENSDRFDEDAAILGEITKRVPTRQDLAIARRRLADFEFVGITEHFNESMSLLCGTFGWSPIPAYESLNVAPATKIRREELPRDVLDTILQMHALDLELYEYARSLFFRRFLKMSLSADAAAC